MNDAAVGQQRIDGRTLRGERTRRAIVDAHLALLEEGDLKPTAERIAERAGVSLRALWTNFKDMEGLFAAAGERLMERQRAEDRPIEPGPPPGDPPPSGPAPPAGGALRAVLPPAPPPPGAHPPAPPRRPHPRTVLGAT